MLGLGLGFGLMLGFRVSVPNFLFWHASSNIVAGEDEAALTLPGRIKGLGSQFNLL